MPDRDFARPWRAFTISELRRAVGYDALPLIAVLLLHSSVFLVSLLVAPPSARIAIAAAGLLILSAGLLANLGPGGGAD